MPSGSTSVTVAFLYSLPLVVLKSSAKTTEAKRISKIRTFEAEGGIIIDCTLLLPRKARAPYFVVCVAEIVIKLNSTEATGGL